VLAQRLQQYCNRRRCQRLAKRTGFQVRQPRKITPLLWLQALCALSHGSAHSLEWLASLVGLFGGQVVSKQAVAKRCNAAAVEFVRQALVGVLGAAAQLPRLRAAGVFSRFRRVLIQDSTSLALAPRLATAFPGSCNQRQQPLALAKIQAIYDLLGERFLWFTLTAFRHNDQAAAPDILAVAQARDLVLRDLGYLVLPVLAQLHQRGCFVVSRFRYGLTLWQENGQPFALRQQLHRQQRLDVWLRLGAAEALPVRLIAVRLPQPQADARRRKARQDRDRRCRHSREYLQLLDWEIFITNVPAQSWSAKTVCEVYGLRWRIEVIFKAWKSHWRIEQLPVGSAQQVELVILARLLSICLLQNSYRGLADYFQRAFGRTLSLLRVSRFFAELQPRIHHLGATPVGASLLIQLIGQHCCYERRRDRHNYWENLQCLG
jgi:hypothetical protein